ncbi:TPA: UDP-N-acetylmuramoyl-tripeptide--D-alanyl-D-alanine ligase [Candidatus Scatousia excrementigallinarum]|uniref:UDP-N-acetylmuramoyl-tripeptide--D-alanyl-D-alanine ligase n=1 Tax=Candidatus Scatousia excrementigallinarum TaxID=2840935 RepID=A0A9D1F0S0_9BACT|nr:UDP-N-acetylmuramoyl-tripeptide--D-alanyl-D-alanine ligase [Candidatus Scatousia excrementigallinarum]
MMFNLDEILKATGAELIKNSSGKDNYIISTDTRTIKQGELYLPLKGASFDGEKFLQNAVEAGACGCFITGDDCPENAQLVLRVSDTLEAYLKLANYARRAHNPKVVAITGSSGKTTTKELVYSVVSKKFKSHKTFSNHNNEIGFCQTVLSMPDDCEVLIIEMGMRGAGEIELLSRYAQPDYAIITNAGSAHIGRLGSLDNIAKAKAEIALHLKEDGTFISQNNERIKNFVKFGGEKIFYSLEDTKILERRPSYAKFIYQDREYELNVDGDYNVENSLAAINLGYKLGMTYEEIKCGLAAYRPIEKRWEVIDVNGYKIINDSYNANPESMKASVSTFVQLYENPVVILGNMGELGDYENELHYGVGEYLSKISPKNVRYLTVGHLAKQISLPLEKEGFFVKNFENNTEVSKFVLANINAGNTIFLKASRNMKFEEIIEQIKGEVKI